MDRTTANRKNAVLFFAGIERLTIKERLGKGERFGDVFYITNEPLVIEALISRSGPSIGHIEFSSLTSGRCVVYSQEETNVEDDDAADGILKLRLAQVSTFFHHIWLTRDHSVGLEYGYLHVGGGQEDARVTRNAFLHTITRADGSQPIEEFGREEFRVVRNSYKLPDEIQWGNQPLATEDAGRVGRAWYFLQAARQEGDLAAKIANYCIVFEALFSTDSSELSHKLAERIAFFLEAKQEERLALYRAIKRAYSVRSKVVHGARAAANVDALTDASKLCDNTARRIMARLMSERDLWQQFERSSSEKHEQFLLELVLAN